MACEALQSGLSFGSWEARRGHCTLNSAQRSPGDAATSVALPSRFFGAKLASLGHKRCSFRASSRAIERLETMKVECRTAEPDHDLSSSDEYWSRIAAQYQQPMFDVCDHATIPDRITTATSERSRSRATLMVPVHEENQIDWRSFRAKLCSTEALDQACARDSSDDGQLADSKQWAHRLSTPEVGCVLIATDKLNHHGFLRGAVILVVGLSQNHSQGIILNKKMPFSAHSRQGADQRVLLGLSGCPKYVGGPVLSTPKISILSEKTDIRGFRTLMPGLAVGGDAALPTLVSAVGSGEIPRDEINVYVGEVEWDSRLLMAEIGVFEWWDVAACSSDTLLQSSPGHLRKNLRSLLSS
ncbi:hypothetical protein Mapa_000508 [Marchantia paleacea]|nr:hypothetical protein Mapa_000508 [Marchantia paleacea]